MRFSLLLAGTAFTALLTVILAAGNPAQGQPPAAPPTAPAKAGGIDFDTGFTAWKELLAQLRELQSKFQTTPSDDRPKLEKEYQALLEKGKQMQAQVGAAAEKAYRANPDNKAEYASFLATLVADQVRRDNFEEAARVVKLLLDNKYDQRGIDDLAGVSYFGSDNFELANQFLTKAQTDNAIGNIGKKFLPDCAPYIDFWRKEQAIRAAEAKTDDLPRVKLETTKGTIVIELFENEAPNTVANFINLVEKKYYDGLKFHRVLEHFMAQGGDPKGTGSGGPGYSIPDECYQENYRKHFRGSLSMAKSAAKDSGGSQFFLTFLATPHLNGQHTVFGRVIQGMEVLSELQRINPDDPRIKAEADKIVKATVIRKRNHPYVPKTTAEK